MMIVHMMGWSATPAAAYNIALLIKVHTDISRKFLMQKINEVTIERIKKL